MHRMGFATSSKSLEKGQISLILFPTSYINIFVYLVVTIRMAYLITNKSQFQNLHKRLGHAEVWFTDVFFRITSTQRSEI